MHRLSLNSDDSFAKGYPSSPSDFTLSSAQQTNLQRYSHLSTDSATTADVDDLTDYHRHRRDDSGSESLCSELTETTATEPHPKGNSSPGPIMSVHSPTHSLSSLSFQYHDLINSYTHDHENELGNSACSVHSDCDNILDLKLAYSNHPTDRISQSTFDHHIELLDDNASDHNAQPDATRGTATSLSPPFSFDFDQEQLDEPCGILERSISDQEKKEKLTKMFSRAASNGDMNRIADMLDNCRDWIDLEAQDEDGTSPLIYAACFGHVEIAFMLLEAGAVVDARDKFGWTALVWATNNKHDSMVRLLLENGASTSAQTAKGHTIVDFLRHDPNDNTKIVQIFQEPSRRDSVSSAGSFGRHGGDDHFSPSGLDGFQEIMAENERRYRMAMNSANSFNFDLPDTSTDQYFLEDEDDGEGEFDWERCLPDQMFVFSSKDIFHIVHITVTRMEPLRPRPFRPVPASVMFLAARFACNYSSPELVDELLEASLAAIDSVVKGRPEDMALTSFWISNCSALLHFLRKDAGLKLSTTVHQAKLEAIVQGMVRMLVVDAKRRIEKILEPAMLDHDTIAGLDEVKFQSDWAFLWRGNKSGGARSVKRASSPTVPPSSTLAPRPLKRSGSHSSILSKMNRSASPRQRQISPRTLTTMLSSLLFVMQSYDIHHELIQYAIGQLFHYISGEVFNRMIVNKKLLCRSKALQTRLNLSVLEDWVRLNQLSSKLVEIFSPLVQLLQLLQVLSLQDDLPTWIETMKKLELLNPIQVKRVVNSYRFEVEEQCLPGEIKQYVLQVAVDTEKMVQRQIKERRRERPATMFQESSLSSYSSSSASSSSSSLNPERRASTTFKNKGLDVLDDFLMMDEGQKSFKIPSGPRSRASMGSIGPVTMMTEAQREKTRKRKQEQEEEAALLSETRDSRVWQPFMFPINVASRVNGVDHVFVPIIPDETMAQLDAYAS
ncbi:hypothetical protein BG004_006712 [Podila humilis]|nr:hypothetical protein BG004_006712 [Podila humilis]